METQGEPQPQPDPSDASTPTVLCHAANLIEGELIRGRLADCGIAASVQDASSWQTFWHIQVAVHPSGLPVVVPARDLTRAREILADTPVLGQSSGQTLPPLCEPAGESANEQLIRRGFWTSVIFMLSMLGIILSPYSIRLLHRGRGGWNDANVNIRRRNRRRLIIGWTLTTINLALVIMAVVAVLAETLDWDGVRQSISPPMK